MTQKISYNADGELRLEDDVESTKRKLAALVKGTFSAHSLRHTDGSDDVQSATNAQKGLATAAQITALEGVITDLEEESIVITTIASSATPTPARASKHTDYQITALEEAAEFGAPTGSPQNRDRLVIRIKDNGTARALTWNEIYRAGDIDLPTTTVISKTMYCGFFYNSADSKWDLVAFLDNL